VGTKRLRFGATHRVTDKVFCDGQIRLRIRPGRSGVHPSGRAAERAEGREGSWGWGSGGGRGSGGPGRGILGPEGVTETRNSARAGAEGKAKIQRMTSSK